MKVLFESEFQAHLRDWIQDNKRVAIKVLDLVKAIEQSPFEGIGKPEPLKHGLSGLWSRRIDQAHRLIYSVNEADNEIIFISCYGHYTE